METPTNNKSGSSPTCPKCGGYARDVSTGWFCNMDGLVLDESRNLRPSPDPVSEALRADPERQAAFVAQQEAERRYDLASEQWAAKLSELQAVRIKARNDKGEYEPGGMWRPSRQVRALRQREEELVDEVELATHAREAAAVALRVARRTYQETSAAISTRLGRPVPVSTRGGSRAVLIPNV